MKKLLLLISFFFFLSCNKNADKQECTSNQKSEKKFEMYQIEKTCQILPLAIKVIRITVKSFEKRLKTTKTTVTSHLINLDIFNTKDGRRFKKE